MSGAAAVELAEPQIAADLRNFVSRARAADDGAVRLQAGGTVLAAYVCVMKPRLLGENTPTILGLRTMALARPADADVTVPLASVADRLARMEGDDVVLALPPVTVAEGWAGVLPPRGGWEQLGVLEDSALEAVARAGITEVARSVPANPGALLVNNARGAVWGRPMARLDATTVLPAGAAFAAFTLGFLVPGGSSALYRSGRWLRLSCGRGHVLVKAAAAL